MANKQEQEKKTGYSAINELAGYQKAARADLASLFSLREQTARAHSTLTQFFVKKQREEIAAQEALRQAEQVATLKQSVDNKPKTEALKPETAKTERPDTSAITAPQPTRETEWKPREQWQPRQNTGFKQQSSQRHGGGQSWRPNPQQQNTGTYSHGAPRQFNNNQGSGFGGGQRPYAPRPFGSAGNAGARQYGAQSGGTRPAGNFAGGSRQYGNAQIGGQRPYASRPFGSAGNAGARPFSGVRPANLEPITSILKKDTGRGRKDYGRGSGNDEIRTLSKRQKQKIYEYDAAIDYETEQRMGSRKLRFKKEKEEINIVSLDSAVITKSHITVKELSEKISKSVSEILKKLIQLGLMLTINSVIDFETAALVAGEFGIKLENRVEKTFEEKIKEIHKAGNGGKEGKKRAPIVTVMGHVDHGKTSLLDAIRKTTVVSSEAGGITQHIGAYSITKNGEKITFIDTPGHAAFTSMRARGAKIMDVAILVVAADDGIMPQTIEAINHIKSVGSPMIVAINKMDKPEANPERVKQQLTEHAVVPEEWGGDAVIVPISAKTGEGLDKILEMILLLAEVQNLVATENKEAVGTVLEAKLDKTRGTVATLLVQEGTLKIGDHVVAGTSFGKVKAIASDSGAALKSAGPSEPVEIIGLDDVPKAGDYFYVVDASLSRQVIEERKNKIKEERIKSGIMSAEDLLAKVDEGKLKALKLIIKSDVQGSAEALKYSLQALSNNEIKVNCITAVAGQVTESDIVLAATSGATVIAFNIKTDSKTDAIAKQNKVNIKKFKIIYEAVEFVKKEVAGLKEKKYKEEPLGKAEVRNIFKLSSSGAVAGCMVLEGKIRRNAKARLVRNDSTLADDVIDSLKIAKEDQREVASGFECGIRLAKFTAYATGDIIECYSLIEVIE